MELRHLRYLVAIAGTGSFTRAAEVLGIAQPTLSHQIKQMETELGAVLFDRFPRVVVLTEAGRGLLPHAQRMLVEMDAAINTVSELQGLLRGTLNVGLFHSFSRSQVSSVLAKFAQEHPGLQVVARLLPRAAMERELLDGSLDLAIAYVSEDTEHIAAEKLFEEELVLAVGPSHPLANAPSVEMQALRDERMVLLTREFSSRQMLNRFLGDLGATPNVVLEVNSIEAILSIVRSTALSSVLAAGAIDALAGVSKVRLLTPTPRRWVALLWRKDGHRTAAALRMADMIRDVYARASAANDDA
ncbi:Cyn operon transcriptional activator [Variovorax sp. PBL-H6]|uniref:LysR substrate-binding domain-containing protein n=1 Tax=Variovorax sp. PBL-H6 TaxID=434009 RepID=UPI0013171EC2|nr:LysR substrate-binding domain-containing protein [Variovorax sp. PBL-H6]VTU16269.1 Cyn operon transcriptional activator [Variovorax sp. PBL-H6]